MNVQACGAQTNVAVMVIRLDAKPASAAAAVASTAYVAAPGVQVRESRDLPEPVVTSAVVTSSSTSSAAAAGGGGSSEEFVRAAISIEGAPRARHQQARSAVATTGPSTGTPTTKVALARQRFVKRAAGVRDVELRQTSPSSSLSSGSSGRPTNHDDEATRRPAGTEGLPPSAATAEPAVDSTDDDVVQLTSNAGRSVAGRVAMFDQRAASSDSSASVSTDGVTPTSAGAPRQKPPLPPPQSTSEDRRGPVSVARTSPGRQRRRRALPVNPDKFRLDTSGVGGDREVSSVSVAAAREPDEQGTAKNDEEITRL